MKLGVHFPHVTPDLLTKLHVQLLHILTVIPFFITAMLEF
jgi:amino acid permease